MWPRFCGGDIYSRRKPLFSRFGEHTAVCGSSVRQAVARPRHRQSVCIHNIHVAATCRLVCSGPPQVAKQSGPCARALSSHPLATFLVIRKDFIKFKSTRVVTYLYAYFLFESDGLLLTRDKIDILCLVYSNFC